MKFCYADTSTETNDWADTTSTIHSSFYKLTIIYITSKIYMYFEAA